MFRYIAACILAMVTLASPAAAKILTEEQAPGSEFNPDGFICPLTGKQFEQIVTHPHYALESFPDGSHPGDEWIDMQIPECPQDRVPILPDYTATSESEDSGSGRLIYHAYSDDELARIPGLIASEEWSALLGQTRHLRAYWLAKRLGRPGFDRYELLVHSPWSAENDGQKRAALETLVGDLPAIIDELDAPPEYRNFSRYYMVDALRQLGRFEEALALLDKLDEQPVDAEPGEDPDQEYARGDYSWHQRRAIEMENSDRFAIEALDDRMAARLCNNPADYAQMRGPNAERSCKAREERQAREAAERDAVYALLDDRPALDSQCKATATGARDSILEEACRHAQHDVDWAQGERMAKEQPIETAAICERVPDYQRNTVQTSACGWYEGQKSAAIKDLLLADEAAFEAICDTDMVLGYGPLSSGCEDADRVRNYRQAYALWQDKPGLRAVCRDKESLESSYDGRNLACSALDKKDTDPYWLMYGALGAEPEERDPLYDAALPFARAAIETELARRADLTGVE